ncbi:hypothetical protein BCR33DRAFT_852791 [Rhizoclosmatium globosum]|uniref:TLC domain-containing protein n=1 Tax=Rhizoclosmatium globosum TaxID=329046 RepID=A0A1Y2C0E6_9FUNG|nr:hypothetical protein BCR33DRAFT_852791 [Rhizoclosmatium globosum]|eukprot:ORY40480.1 hypothetical protein BCR33DRAFT_852791 [Rhizoclosmatium globosum]
MAIIWAFAHFVYFKQYGHPLDDTLDKDELKRFYKTRTAVWRGLVFTFSTIYGIIIGIVEKWPVYPNRYFPPNPWAPFEPITLLMEGYWMCMFGFYLYDLIWTLFAMDQVKKQNWPAELGKERADFIEIVVHHCVTVTLVVIARWAGFYRFGVVTFWLHDVADPFLYAAKIANYQGRMWIADVLFYIYSGIFILALNIVFPGLVIWVTFTGSKREDIRKSSKLGFMVVCISFCVILCVLHIGTTWSTIQLIIKKLWKPKELDVEMDTQVENKEKHVKN